MNIREQSSEMKSSVYRTIDHLRITIFIDLTEVLKVSPSRLFFVGALHLLRQYLEKIWHQIINLNIFQSSNQSDPSDITNQKWSSRLFILLLSLSSFILILYSLLNATTRIVEIQNPSPSTVEALQKHTTSLQCPCKVLSVSYEHFLQIEPHYHQACSSELVTFEWIQALNSALDNANITYLYTDFRSSGFTFQLLLSLCDLADAIIFEALSKFGKTQLVALQLLEPDLFMKEMHSAIQQFEQNLPNELLTLLNLIRQMTFINQFVSASFANVLIHYASVKPNTESTATFLVDGFPSLAYNSTSQKCSCVNDFECGMNWGLYATNNSLTDDPIYVIPGYYVRCFPIESLLGSTLECFYDNHSCLTIVGNIINETLISNLTRLNSSQSSRFPINSPIGDLVIELFIESWSETLLYSSYFAQCQPTSCFYTVIKRKSFIEIVTLVSGLVGGASIILRLVCPYVILVSIYIFRRFLCFGGLTRQS
ncbi:unnamed protein product, partial [Rotaria socialis]